MPHNNRSAVNERRRKLWTLLTKGMKGYEIARELNTNESTISRDIKYLSSQSQNYLNGFSQRDVTIQV
jgi:IS30 family transposase